ncbi:MAG TPA: 3-deoxy-D-manno-octulosonic acid transferase [Alphaproteobacteria bacterium]|nr:3-deoxy-D-manno-octulosonic acid transferase [Alphaproteobacteria bacterium]
MLAFAYRLLTDLSAPFIGLYLWKRRRQGREDATRFGERFGRTSRPRPSGNLIWCHAASVGEAASILALLRRLRALYPATHILVTTGTVTSAKMLETRLPEGAFHQYVPVDRAAYVERFLDHWKPDFALLIESELWPNLLDALRKRLIPATLLNGRMSDKSFRRWYRAKTWARELMGAFVLCLTQTEDERGRFVALGARPARAIGNLKYAADPLPADEKELGRLKELLGRRPAWLMASSHRGEEDIACAAHKRLRVSWPDMLTVIVPRHARRGEEIARLIAEQGLRCARRSQAEDIAPGTDIYLADTMGELGLFYRLCPIAVIGGSFVRHGGHNPIEPAQLGCAIIFGPYMQNFAAIARDFTRADGALGLQGAGELAFTLDRLLQSPGERVQMARAARFLAEDKGHVLDQVMDALAPWIDPRAEGRDRGPGNRQAHRASLSPSFLEERKQQA